MQAITTKYIGPSNTKGSRVVARCQARAIFRDWDYSIHRNMNHRNAAMELAKLMQWDGNWYGGWLPDGQSAAWVCQTIDGRESFTVEVSR